MVYAGFSSFFGFWFEQGLVPNLLFLLSAFPSPNLKDFMARKWVQGPKTIGTGLGIYHIGSIRGYGTWLMVHIAYCDYNRICYTLKLMDCDIWSSGTLTR